MESSVKEKQPNVKNTKGGKSSKKQIDMKKRKRALISFIAIILVLIIILIIVKSPKKEDKSDVTNKYSEEKTFESYKLKDFTINYDQDTTIFDFKIENIGSANISSTGLNIILLDKEGNEITSIGLYLKETEPGEVIDSKAVIQGKIENVYDIRIQRDQNIINE